MKTRNNLNWKALLLLLLVAAGMAKAQTHEFAPVGAEWNSQWNVLLSQESTNVQFTVIFASFNDSIMYEGIRYKIIIAEEDDYNFDYGLLKEEAGRLFFRKHIDLGMFEDEVLLYDWTLSEGDTVFVQRGSEDNGLVLNSIQDTIMNDVQRRKFTFSYLANPELKEKWIEGMGSELGFPFSGTKIQPESYLGFAAKSELLCYHEGEEVVWQNPNYDTCLINFESVQYNSERPGLQVYPNPAEDVLHLRYDDEFISDFVYQIFNCQGLCCVSGVIKQSDDISIAHISKGFYLLIIKSPSLTENWHFRFVKK